MKYLKLSLLPLVFLELILAFYLIVNITPNSNYFAEGIFVHNKATGTDAATAKITVELNSNPVDTIQIGQKVTLHIKGCISSANAYIETEKTNQDGTKTRSTIAPNLALISGEARFDYTFNQGNYTIYATCTKAAQI